MRSQPKRWVSRIRTVIGLLAHSPYLGHPGQRGTRFLSIAGLPYVIIYRVEVDIVRVFSIFHTARDRRF
jgi:plasmid stabilization system protein ParE